MKKINIGIIGAGGIARWHIQSLLKEPELFDVKILCDTDADVLKELEGKHNVRGCVDYKDILDDPSIDAVVVSLPHHLHLGSCVAAARKGKHIFLEKPIARTFEEAEMIIEAAEKYHVTLMIGHNQRYAPQIKMIHEQLAKGSIGVPLYAFTSHNQNFLRPSGGWWRSRDLTGGGAVIGSGIHNLDLMRWFFGEPEEVFAFSIGDLQRLEAEVAASISVKFKNKTIANFSCNWGVHGDFIPDTWGIFGTEGHILTQGDNLLLGRKFGKKKEILVPETYSAGYMWKHFADCVVNGKKPLTNGEEGLKSLLLVLKIYESLRTNTPAFFNGDK